MGSQSASSLLDARSSSSIENQMPRIKPVLENFFSTWWRLLSSLTLHIKKKLFFTGFAHRKFVLWKSCGLDLCSGRGPRGPDSRPLLGVWVFASHILLGWVRLIYLHKQIAGLSLPAVREIFEVHERRACRLDLCNLQAIFATDHI